MQPIIVSVIDDIKTRLAKYPDARYEADASSITVFPTAPEGFSVGLTLNSDNSYTVSFDGWHEEFDDADEALNIFSLGLSDECRLRENRRGNFVYRWTVETLEDGRWQEQSTTSLLLFPFWMKRKMRYLQNKLLTRKSE